MKKLLDYLFARDIKAELERDRYVRSRMWPDDPILIDDSSHMRMIVETSLIPNIANVAILFTSIYSPLVLMGAPLIEYCRVKDRKEALKIIKKFNRDRVRRISYEAEKYMNEIGDIPQ